MSDIVSRVYELPGRATRAVIDLDAIADNVRALRANQAPGQGLMAVVKADGYGHGAEMTARVALESGADRVGVATVGEASALRAAGVTAPMLILGPIDSTEIDRAIDADTDLLVGSLPLLDAIAARAEALRRIVSVHVKVDTGMHRYGVVPDDAVQFIEAVLGRSALRLAGICTHLATADDPASPVADFQLAEFKKVIDEVRPLLPLDVAIHAANSAASIRRLFPGGTFDRVGIAMYGLRPGPDLDLLPGMRPALSVITRLTRVHTAVAGDRVSYGRTHVVDEPEVLGLAPIGYVDGYRRALSNRGWARIAGTACPVRGRVCMDQTVFGDLPASARTGDPFGLLGPLLNGPSADELASAAGTINYEIVAGLSPRIPRYYARDGRVVATLIEGQVEEC